MRLDTLRVPTPCREDWEAMHGDEQARHCGVCDQTVTNLSALTRPEAEAELTRLGQLRSSCVRFLRAPTGEIITRTTQQEQLLALLRAMGQQKPEGDP
jgi:hypothetical protein